MAESPTRRSLEHSERLGNMLQTVRTPVAQGKVAVASADFLIYLELIRFLAAASVVIDHISSPEFFGGADGALSFIPPGIGRIGVVVFFVLSGYIIAWRHNVCRETSVDYVANRISRLYSVLPLALFLTPILDWVGMHGSTLNYSVPLDDRPMQRLLVHFFMLQEYWVLGVRYFSNSPLWTLSYEAVYYALYYLVFYAKKPLLAVALLLCAGPKIALLAPLWILGVVVLNLTRRGVQWGTARHFAYIFLVMVLIFIWFSIRSVNVIDVFGEGLGWAAVFFGGGAGVFFSDYLLGAAVALHFALVAARPPKFNVFLRRTIKALAGFSFELYALHMPVITLVVALIGGASYGGAIFTLALCIGVAWSSLAITSRLKVRLRLLTKATVQRIAEAVDSRHAAK